MGFYYFFFFFCVRLFTDMSRALHRSVTHLVIFLLPLITDVSGDSI